MKKLIIWSVLVSTALLSGCISSYKSVTEGPAAKVTFAVKDIEKGIPLFSPELTYIISSCNPKERGQIKLKSSHKSETVRVKAGEPLDVTANYFMNGGAGPSTRGSLDLLFLPVENHSYLVEYERMGNKFRVLVWNVDKNGQRTKRARTVYGPANTDKVSNVICRKLGKI